VYHTKAGFYMIQSLNFPLEKEYAASCGGWAEIRKRLAALRLDGLEGIWAGVEEIPEDFPVDLLTGYHLTFFPDWVDLYLGNKKELERKFGSEEVIRSIYGGTDPECLLDVYRKDLDRARRMRAEYIVFHVSDVSLEEVHTYRWLHDDRTVLDASVMIINDLLKDIPPEFDFLVENQWWPGFTFTDPAKTDYLLSKISYPRTGIMLDTGHLMNTNPKIRTQKEGVRYILDMLHAHGSLTESIKGMHFHQSISGRYVRANTGKMPADSPEDYWDAFMMSYRHIQRIDRHRPWTDPTCRELIEAVRPEYLTHELAASGIRQFAAAARQISTIRSSNSGNH